MTALLTSQLASLMRQRAEVAWQREREARILYEVMHVANQKIGVADQMDSIALALVLGFSPWGVRECALLLPDGRGDLKLEADAPIQIERFVLSDEEFPGRTRCHGFSPSATSLKHAFCYWRSGSNSLGFL